MVMINLYSILEYITSSVNRTDLFFSVHLLPHSIKKARNDRKAPVVGALLVYFVSK